MEAWDNPYYRWFRLAMWFGIVGNLAFAIPAVLNPDALLAWLSLPPTDATIWVRDAGGLLFFLTLLYVPAAQDPFRYRWNAAVAVIGRLLFACFWFWMVLVAGYPPKFLALGIGDLMVGLFQALLHVPLTRHQNVSQMR